MATGHNRQPPPAPGQGIMAEPRRVFINYVDSYASGNIAKLLCERVLNQDEENVTSEPDGVRAFRVVGTVYSEFADAGCAQEKLFVPTRKQLLSKVMECDVIIYNITEHGDQVEEVAWLVSALHDNMNYFSGPKLFILVSTVMTWACTLPANHDGVQLPFTDGDFRRRRAHPNFKRHIDLEKKVVKLGKTNRATFSTYVVASGLQYGMEEQIFHFFFKRSWLGNDKEIPVFGGIQNIVPTIHVKDLASVILKLMENPPKQYYLLAVDSSHNTLDDIVKAIAVAVGPGKIQKKPLEEAFLQHDFTVMEIDSMQVNLIMEAFLIKDLFSINWRCASGMVANIDLLAQEYRQTRGLQPVRVCVLGPPAVGKTTMSKYICKHYKLQHIRLKDAISETITHLEEEVDEEDPEADPDVDADLDSDADADADGDQEDEEPESEARQLLKSLKIMEQSGGQIDDQLSVKVTKDKLMSYHCKNQGFVLDGFPETYEQARELFAAEEGGCEDETSKVPSHNKRMIPEFVLCLDASDAFLKDRVMNLTERLVQEHNYEQDNFLRQLRTYRERIMEEETSVDYFEELGITPVHLELTSGTDPDGILLMQKVCETLGSPRNYGPSIQEIQEEEKRKAEERLRKEAQWKAEEEVREAEELSLTTARWEEWTKGLDKVKQQEAELLEAQSVPIRSYLKEHVMPTLIQGLIQCCSSQPQDPVDFLAEYLMKNNPLNA